MVFPLPTNRTIANTVAEHLADHNDGHALLNVLNGSTIPSVPKAPLVDQVNRGAADLSLNGGTIILIGSIPAATLRQAQNDYVTFQTLLPSHWQTYDVDVHWAVSTATAGTPTLRCDTKFLGSGVSWNSAYDTVGSNYTGVPAGAQYIEVVSTVAANRVADPTKELLVRIIRLAATPDALASNIGVSRVRLRRVT